MVTDSLLHLFTLALTGKLGGAECVDPLATTAAAGKGPLQEAARETLARELRTGVSNEKLADLVLALHEEDRLCVHEDDTETREPRIICSLGIRKDQPAS